MWFNSMKNILILALISFSLFFIVYAYNINFDEYAHENFEQPKVDSLLSTTDEEYLSLNKEALVWSVKLLADHVNLLKGNSNSRISELKGLVVIVLITLCFNVLFLCYWLYQNLKARRKTT